jgi:hypothetical protein
VSGDGRLVHDRDLRDRRRDDDHELIVSEEPCGCVRLRCTRGHSPEEILEALDAGWTVDDLLCDEHRRRS